MVAAAGTELAAKGGGTASSMAAGADRELAAKGDDCSESGCCGAVPSNGTPGK